MKRAGLHILLILFLTLIHANASAADSVDIWLDSARSAYDGNEPEKALKFYKKVAAEKHSPFLYYNMGNAAFKTGELGPAIHYFRMAEKERPWDSDIQHNLELALEKTRDDFQGAETKSMAASIEAFIVAAPLGDPWLLAFIASLLSGTALGSLAFTGREWRSSLWGLFFFFLFLAAVFFGADRWRTSIIEQEDRAVIMVPSVQVRTAPGSSSSTAFVLHEGTTVEVRGEHDGWTEIQTPDDQVGWLRSGEARTF